MGAVTGTHVSFQYQKDRYILKDLDFRIESGKMTVLLGKNGCGKSTLVKLIMALFPLSMGNITVNSFDINSPQGIDQLRKHCGIVFQNPDNQFAAPVVEDDIRFGLNNHRIAETEQQGRIRKALELVRLSGFEKRSINSLSGGQKQRAAAAGILAIDNDILIFDESTSMLDPDGKADLLSVIGSLRDQGKTILLITQNVSDAVHADRVMLMSEGKIFADGTPREILTQISLLKEAGVSIPFPVRVYFDLKNRGIVLTRCPLTTAELAEEICRSR